MVSEAKGEVGKLGGGGGRKRRLLRGIEKVVRGRRCEQGRKGKKTASTSTSTSFLLFSLSGEKKSARAQDSNLRQVSTLFEN